ncbi:hypothetical protein E1263_03910 [Kribbella antibiotica]|uniref:TrbL/VirB6 plasmid conjugal transfer protein n=1 Tax=Kribbella antibiotica TaxID=190195 RepID=A0A4R4ZTA3_9ACTN|nr:hypothetical protein [Kribbella antibiotica]TDD62311.1 hypothetical protein E1263_03910 [Kribbella antibiotica]
MLALGCSLAPWDWDDCVAEFLGEVVDRTLSPIFKLLLEAIAKVVIEAVEAVMKAVAFLWIYIPTGDVQNNGAISWIHTRTTFIMISVATLAVIVGAIQMAVSHRGEPLRDILKSLLTMVVVNAGLLSVVGALVDYADQFSGWIIGEALATNKHDFAKELTIRMVEPLKSPTELLGFAMIIFVGILMVICAIIQLALMVVRYGMLVLLVGIFPITTAATNTEMGMMWFKRSLAWLFGFILYKPVAALIYAAAITMISTPAAPKGVTPPKGTPEMLNIVMGVTMMLLAVVALPAILRFVSPKTS